MDIRKIQKIRESLKDFLKNNENLVSAKKIGFEIGYSAGAISQFLNDKYVGDSEKLSDTIEKYLEEQKDKKLNTSTRLHTVKTNSLQEVFKVAHHAKRRKKLCVVTGVPGTGKSRAVEEYEKRFSGVIRIECVPNITPKPLFESLHEKLKLSASGTVYSMFLEAKDRLIGTNILLIFDEAEQLPKKCLELIRRLGDLTEIGILLVGTKQLIRNLRGKKGEYAQLYSRVALHHEIDVITERDAKLIIEENLPGAMEYWQLIYSYTKKNVRALEYIIDNTRAIVEEQNIPITEDLIADVAETLITQ